MYVCMYLIYKVQYHNINLIYYYGHTVSLVWRLIFRYLAETNL